MSVNWFASLLAAAAVACGVLAITWDVRASALALVLAILAHADAR